MTKRHPILEPLRRLNGRLYRWRRSLQSRWFAPIAAMRLRFPGRSRDHGLPTELVVSLTSFAERFPSLHLTLGCLLDQSVRPDRVILWLSHEDRALVPDRVASLQQRGLEIRTCDDLRSFKKLVPAVEAFPDASIVTADDDIYFARDWLELLVVQAQEQPAVIGYHRGHRIRRNVGGAALPYRQWQYDVQDAAARMPSSDVLPTTGSGALFPPGSLAPYVTDRQLFQRLCPHGDDLWFHWCARENGTLQAKVGPRMGLHTWPGSQDNTLWSENAAGGNDRMIAALEREFGKRF